jgi:hypothetical protein
MMEKEIVAEVKKGRLPFQQEGDRIAKYGKGYSNLLHLAGTPNEYTGSVHHAGSGSKKRRRKAGRHKESVQDPESVALAHQ